MVDLVNKTREKTGISLGASPRASIALMKTAQAQALFDNQSFVSADHIQEIAVSVIAHRLVLDHQSKFSGCIFARPDAMGLFNRVRRVRLIFSTLPAMLDF
ncbi:AAA family ATPase [Desulfobacula sp.]